MIPTFYVKRLIHRAIKSFHQKTAINQQNQNINSKVLTLKHCYSLMLERTGKGMENVTEPAMCLSNNQKYVIAMKNTWKEPLLLSLCHLLFYPALVSIPIEV